MPEPRIAPYGSWKSPITADLILAGSVGLGGIALDGDDLYWIEGRPSEGGRHVIVRRTPDGRTADLNPPPFNARTRVHEYGGGDYTVADGTVYFSNFDDQRIYRVAPGGEPEPRTPAAALRYADGTVDRRRGRLICVQEDHTGMGREAVNSLISIDLRNGDNVFVLASGGDFYSSPRLSPDGSRLAWLTWSHPNMPWDGTELWVGDLDDGGHIRDSRRVAGGLDESIYGPEWSPDGVLHFISDRTGWWNLYRHRDGRDEPLCPMDAEFGIPQWTFGTATYAFTAPDRLVCSYIHEGTPHLAALDGGTGQLDPIEISDPDLCRLGVGMGTLRVGGSFAVFIAASATAPSAIVRLDLSNRKVEIIRRSSDLRIDPGYLSIPESIEFPTEGGLTAYGFYYAPRNRDFRAPEGEKPPLIVLTHGGPTGATTPSLKPRIQYFTSRGFAVLDVNYGGSAGYGRAYRERLNGRWGIVDVDDCVNGARYLAERGLADRSRLAIEGGSAGGYTTLAALTFRDLFRAGASYFGVSDLEGLAKETHKFESRYLDGLIGPYPERRDLYIERSPIHFTGRLSCPVIFFQGLEDAVVPPNQAERMVEALREKGLPVAYVAFPGEQHGFRRAENIKRSIEGDLYFYSLIFGFALADAIEPVPIENL